MKDVPTEMPDDLVVAGVPERVTARDALITPDGRSLAELPAGATVGTSSLRRRAQLLAERPDLTVEPLRGNVDTRVEKLLAPHLQREHERRLTAEEGGEDGGGEGDADDGESDAGNEDDGDVQAFDESAEEWFDGLAEVERSALGREVDVEYDTIMLAEAGLRRSGLAGDIAYQPFDPAEFVPAPGQGALAVTARDGDLARDIRGVLDHPRSRIETTVERIVLEEVGGGCIAPLGVHAALQGEFVHARARVLAEDGGEEVSATRDLSVEQYAAAARDLGVDLRDRGAVDLIAAAGESPNPPRGDGP